MAENTAENGQKKRNYGPKEPVTVSVTQILQWLEEGETRPEIAARLGLNLGQVNALFASSPKLKGKKTKKDLTKSFNLVDDTTDAPADANGTGQAVQEAQPQGATASWE